jgi:methionine-rich copper-binding protein CopC
VYARILHSEHSWRHALASVLAALWLSACGGGGDTASTAVALGSSPSFSTPSAYAPTQTPAARQTQAAAPAQITPSAQAQTAAPAQTVASAQAVAPSTEEFRVNTTTAGNQTDPAIARLKDGSHVIAWKSEQSPPSVGVQGVCTQRYGANGQALGGEACFAPNVAPLAGPVAVALAQGGYLIIWAEPQSGRFGNTNVWAQRFDTNGIVLGGAQQINSVTSGDSAIPVGGAGLADGGYVVTWASAFTRETSSDIFARRFGADGAPCPCGSEKRVNTFISSFESSRGQPMVAALKDGGYVISWISINQDVRGGAVFAQRYGSDPNSGPVGRETPLARNPLGTLTGGRAGDQTITALANGGYVLTYQLTSSTPDERNRLFQVVVQPFAADGTALADLSLVDPPLPGAPIRLCTSSRIPPNTPCPVFQGSPAVEALDDGSFVVAWTADKSSIGANESYVRRYSGEGAPLGAPTRFTPLGVTAVLSPTSGGGFVVAFDELNRVAAFPSTSEIKARYFDARAFRDNTAP